MNFNLFLDDIRSPDDVTWVVLPKGVEWTIARNFEEFKAAVAEHGVPSFVSFDHDLGDAHYASYFAMQNGTSYEDAFVGLKEKTGLDCVKWLISQILLPNLLPFPKHTLHSMNGPGVLGMESHISSYTGHLDRRAAQIINQLRQ